MRDTRKRRGIVLAIATMKGGTGKSSTAAALLQAAQSRGFKVLGVDTDPQGNLTSFLRADGRKPGTRYLLEGIDPRKVIQTSDQGIDVISANPDLAAETSGTGTARRLADGIADIRGEYDLTIIDTPPGIGELVYNGLFAADRLLIPIQADATAIQAVYDILDIARKIHPEGEIAGTVITNFDSRAKVYRQFKDRIEKKAAEAGAPLLGVIRRGVALTESQALKRSLYVHAPNSNPAKDYSDLLDKLLSMK